MAKSFMLNVSENFNLETFAEEFVENYQGKGYNVRKMKMKNGVKLTVEKGVGGINTLLGMGQGITATCTIHGKEKDSLSVNLSDGDWMGKIIGLAVGWLLCLIPFITSIVGIIRQTSLEKSVSDDIQMLISEEE